MALPLDANTAAAIKAFRQNIIDKNAATTGTPQTYATGWSESQALNNGQLDERVALGNDLSAGDPFAQDKFYNKAMDAHEALGGGYAPGRSRGELIENAIAANPGPSPSSTSPVQGLAGALGPSSIGPQPFPTSQPLPVNTQLPGPATPAPVASAPPPATSVPPASTAAAITAGAPPPAHTAPAALPTTTAAPQNGGFQSALQPRAPGRTLAPRATAPAHSALAGLTSQRTF